MTDGLSPPAAPRIIGLAWLRGATRAQRWMWSEAFCKWTRRPLPSVRYARQVGDGQRFALHRGSWMSVLVPIVVVSQFVDVLIAQGVIHVAAEPAHRALLHGLLLFLSLWMVVWAVALRSATRHVDHVLGPHALTLAIGFRQRCRLPLIAIADVRRIEHKASTGGKDWHAAFGLRARDVTLLSPLDPPTLLIALKDDAAGAWWTRNGMPRPLRRWVALYVDQPDAMRAAVTAAIAELPPSDAPQR
jgi:hypothetical protein